MDNFGNPLGSHLLKISFIPVICHVVLKVSWFLGGERGGGVGVASDSAIVVPTSKAKSVSCRY